MKIEHTKITVKDLTSNYEDNDEAGVVGYNGKLDIRPPYQREFIYDNEQRDAVINTVIKDFPLNIMYWSVRDDNGFEIIDGQQRTISICQYVNGDFVFNNKYFHNLEDDKQQQILNYQLDIYQCTGNDSEKLEWFKTINIAGEELTNQELRNAVYHGPWVTDAKRYFSKNGCAAYGLAESYMKPSPIRQTYLETVIRWKSNNNIETYMAKHQADLDAKDLWEYFREVIAWVEATFPTRRKEMKGIKWGELYSQYGSDMLDAGKLETEIAALLADDDVQRKQGIYFYVLTREEKHLNVRTFTAAQKSAAYAKQQGICSICHKHFTQEEMEADHITPWHKGGQTIPSNCQMLCQKDNRIKGGK